METYTKTYSNGAKECEGTLIFNPATNDKVRTGVWKCWYPNGKLKSNVFYVNGLEQGVATSWYMDGTIHSETCYENGLMHGYSRLWNGSGVLCNEYNYRNGKLHGLSREWFKSGQIASETELRDGVLDGIDREWWLNGQLMREVIYSNGLMKGVVKEWFETGQLRRIGEFDQRNIDDTPFKVGRHKSWYCDETPCEDILYDLGNPVEGTKWDEDGNIKEIISLPNQPLIVERETKHECIIYHCEVPSGEKYMVCSFSEEHVHSYTPLQNFLRVSHQKEATCQYCTNPMKGVIYKQP